MNGRNHPGSAESGPDRDEMVHPAVGGYTERPMEVAVPARVRLNLREGPGISFPVKVQLEQGTALSVLTLPYGADVPGWFMVRCGELNGWVAAQYLRETEG